MKAFGINVNFPSLTKYPCFYLSVSVFSSGLSKIWSKLILIKFLFGLWLPASFESDNREASNFLIVFLVLLEFCHKALTYASLLLILYAEISFRSYRTIFSLHSLAVGRLSGFPSQHCFISCSQKDGGLLQPCLWTGRLPSSTHSKKSWNVVTGASAKTRCPYHISHIISPRL